MFSMRLSRLGFRGYKGRDETGHLHSTKIRCGVHFRALGTGLGRKYKILIPWTDGLVASPSVT